MLHFFPIFGMFSSRNWNMCFVSLGSCLHAKSSRLTCYTNLKTMLMRFQDANANNGLHWGYLVTNSDYSCARHRYFQNVTKATIGFVRDFLWFLGVLFLSESYPIFNQSTHLYGFQGYKRGLIRKRWWMWQRCVSRLIVTKRHVGIQVFELRFPMS